MKLGKRQAKGRVKAPKKQFLYAYGDLQREGHPSDVIARGVLKIRNGDEGPDAAAHFGPEDHGILYGQRVPVSADTLRFLDGVEKPEYKRISIDTSMGPAWTYAYVGDGWDAMSEVPGGNWAAFTERHKMAGEIFKPNEDELPPEADGG